jgi:hypothetical protein
MFTLLAPVIDSTRPPELPPSRVTSGVVADGAGQLGPGMHWVRVKQLTPLP